MRSDGNQSALHPFAISYLNRVASQQKKDGNDKKEQQHKVQSSSKTGPHSEAEGNIATSGYPAIQKWEAKRRLIASALGTSEDLTCYEYSQLIASRSPPPSGGIEYSLSPSSTNNRNSGAPVLHRHPLPLQVVKAYTSYIQQMSHMVMISSATTTSADTIRISSKWNKCVFRIVSLPGVLLRSTLANAVKYATFMSGEDHQVKGAAASSRPDNSVIIGGNRGIISPVSPSNLSGWSQSEAVSFTVRVLSDPLLDRKARKVMWAALAQLHDHILQRVDALFADAEADAFLKDRCGITVAALKEDLFHLPGDLCDPILSREKVVVGVRSLPHTHHSLFKFSTRSETLQSALGRAPTNIFVILTDPHGNHDAHITLSVTDSLWLLLAHMSQLRRLVSHVMRFDLLVRAAASVSAAQGKVDAGTIGSCGGQDLLWRSAADAAKIASEASRFQAAMEIAISHKHAETFLVKCAVTGADPNNNINANNNNNNSAEDVQSYDSVQSFYNYYNSLCKQKNVAAIEERKHTDRPASHTKPKAAPIHQPLESHPLPREDEQFMKAVFKPQTVQEKPALDSTHNSSNTQIGHNSSMGEEKHLKWMLHRMTFLPIPKKEASNPEDMLLRSSTETLSEQGKTKTMSSMNSSGDAFFTLFSEVEITCERQSTHTMWPFQWTFHPCDSTMTVSLSPAVASMSKACLPIGSKAASTHQFCHTIFNAPKERSVTAFYGRRGEQFERSFVENVIRKGKRIVFRIR